MCGMARGYAPKQNRPGFQRRPVGSLFAFIWDICGVHILADHHILEGGIFLRPWGESLSFWGIPSNPVRNGDENFVPEIAADAISDHLLAITHAINAGGGKSGLRRGVPACWPA